jgi:carboxypeptidase Q
MAPTTSTSSSPYLPNYHASSDVYDAVDAREAHINAAIAAAVIWRIADAPDRPGPRQSRAEVQHLLEQTGLVDVMKAFGQWKDWESARRGANP